MIRSYAMAASIAAALAFPVTAFALSPEAKVSLQAAMFQHIESTLIDGVIPHVELEDGSIVDLVPTKGHPMILTFGKHYVLCTDYRDPKGNFVNVDFYMTSQGGRYVVFQTEINNRDPLKRLMETGKLAMAE